VSGRFELGTCSHILSPTVLLIHFYLSSITSTFHAGIIHQSLSDYFPHGGLDTLDVPFDLGTDEAAKEYTRCHAPNRFGTVNMEDNVNIKRSWCKG